MFERLSDKEKELVRKGEISKGMSQEAVSLAWGSPSKRAEGFRDGKLMERWDYHGTEPVVTSNVFAGYGGYPYGGYGYGGFGPQITYIPYRKSTVWFVGGRVEEWERMK